MMTVPQQQYQMFQNPQGYVDVHTDAQYAPRVPTYPGDEREIMQLKHEQQLVYDGSESRPSGKRKLNEIETKLPEDFAQEQTFASEYVPNMPVSTSDVTYPYTTYVKRTKYDDDETGTDVTGSKVQNGFGSGYQFNGVFENGTESFEGAEVRPTTYEAYSGIPQSHNALYQQGREIRPSVVY